MQNAMEQAQDNLFFDGLKSTLRVSNIVDDFSLPEEPQASEVPGYVSLMVVEHHVARDYKLTGEALGGADDGWRSGRLYLRWNPHVCWHCWRSSNRCLPRISQRPESYRRYNPRQNFRDGN